jgi:hypothetical protein
MKRKELYEYIREQIINELTVNEGTAEDNAAKAAELKSIDAQIKALTTKRAEVNKSGAVSETELEELASYKFFRVADRAKFDALKDIYAGTLDARVLDAIEEAGEQGITQANLASALGIASALINPILKKFGSVNAITLPVSEKPGKAAAEEPEMEEPETEEPTTSTEEPGSEFFMGGDEEDEEDKAMEPIDEPVEPSAADIAAAEKELGVSTADKEKVEAANKAAGIVKNLATKIGGMKKGPEREKKLAALKQYIKNNRNIITKVGKISDLTNGLIS